MQLKVVTPHPRLAVTAEMQISLRTRQTNNVAVVRLFGLWLLYTSDHTWVLAEHLRLPARLTSLLPPVGRLLVCCFYVHATFKFRSPGTLIVRRRLAALPHKVSDTSAYKLHVAGGIGMTAFSARTRYLS